MNLVRASLFHVESTGMESGCIFHSGSSKGYTSNVYVAIIFPVGVHEITQLPSAFFNSKRSGFYNLNNCDHWKLDGTLIASQSETTEKIDITKSIYGPIFQTNHAIYHSMICPGQNILFEKTVFGDYNQNGEYLWTSSYAVIWIAEDMFMSIIGNPCVRDNKKWNGSYWITGVQVRAYNGYFERKQTLIYTGRKTTSCSVYDIVGIYQTLIRAQLNSMAWGTQGYTPYDVIHGCEHSPSVPTFSSMHLYNAFPPSEMLANVGDLAARAYSSTQFFSGNGVAFLGDLGALKSSATTTASLIGKLTGAGASLSVIAKLFLAFHYGWRLFASDCQSLSKSIDRYTRLTRSGSKCSANTTIVHGNRTYFHNFSCYYVRNDQVKSQLDQVASMLDLPLSLTNLWDLIPFSFVADWFTNLSSSCESIDSYYRMTQRHTIVCTGQSIKCKVTMTGPKAAFTGWQGSCTISHYCRNYTSQIIYPSLILDNQTHPLQHIVEGGALIVSKR